MFSCAPSDQVIARVLVEHILADPKLAGTAKRLNLALVNATDHESRMTAREVLKEFSRREVLPILRLECSPGAHDLVQQLTSLQESHPAAVLIIAAPEDAAHWVRAVRERLSGLIFGSQAMARFRFRELAGPAAEGARFPLLFAPDPADADAARFVEYFSAERGRLPDYTAALTYDATRLLIAAIQRAGPNRARIREALTQLSPWHGIAGVIRFDGTGQNSRTDICMGTIRNGAVARWMQSPSDSNRKEPCHE